MPIAWRSVATPLISGILKKFCAKVFKHTLYTCTHFLEKKSRTNKFLVGSKTPNGPGRRVAQVRAFLTLPTTSVILGPGKMEPNPKNTNKPRIRISPKVFEWAPLASHGSHKQQTKSFFRGLFLLGPFFVMIFFQRTILPGTLFLRSVTPR